MSFMGAQSTEHLLSAVKASQERRKLSSGRQSKPLGDPRVLKLFLVLLPTWVRASQLCKVLTWVPETRSTPLFMNRAGCRDYQDMGNRGEIDMKEDAGKLRCRQLPRPTVISSCLAVTELRHLSPPCQKYHCIFYVKHGPAGPKVTTLQLNHLWKIEFKSICDQGFSWRYLKGKFFFYEKAKAVCFFLLSKKIIVLWV